jgi:hypothetical protein
MSKKSTAPAFESVQKEQHGLEHIERDKTDEDGVEQVVILGYN